MRLMFISMAIITKIVFLFSALNAIIGLSVAQITFYGNDGVYSTEVAQLLTEYTGLIAEPLINYSAIYVPYVLDDQDVTGLVVVTPAVFPIERPIRKLQQNGAVAVVLAHDGIMLPGRSFIETDGSKANGITIPAFEVGYYAVQMIPSLFPSADTQIMVSIESSGNPWTYILDYHVDVAFSVVMGTGAALCVCLSIWKLVLFTRERGRISQGIPQTCLALHLVSNFIRLLYVVVDPIGIRHLWTYYADNIMFTLPYPIVIVSSLLMSLYWVEAMTSASITVYPGLRKMRVPFIVFSIALGVLEITCGIIRSVGVVGASLTVIITGIVYAITVASMNIFFMVVSIILLRRMKKSQQLNQKRAKNLRLVTWLIIGSVVFFWICFISVIMFLLPEIAGDISGWIAINFLLILSIIGVSLCQILVFNPRAVRATASSSGNGRREMSTDYMSSQRDKN